MQLATSSPPQVDAIVTDDKSRLSRDAVDLAQIVERLQHAKVPLVALVDRLDTRARGAEGRSVAGTLAYGYRPIPVFDADGEMTGHRIEIDPDKAQVIRWIFKEYVAGKSYVHIARELNARGTPAPRGKWLTSMIRAILHNERYAGVWRYNSVQWVSDRSTSTRRRVARPAHEIITHACRELAIIVAETWASVKERMTRSWQ